MLNSNVSAKCSGETVDFAVISIIRVTSLFWMYKLWGFFCFFSCFGLFCSFQFPFHHFPPDCIWRWCCVVSFPGSRPCIVDDSFNELVFNDALCSMAWQWVDFDHEQFDLHSSFKVYDNKKMFSFWMISVSFMLFFLFIHISLWLNFIFKGWVSHWVSSFPSFCRLCDNIWKWAWCSQVLAVFACSKVTSNTQTPAGGIFINQTLNLF